MSAKRYECGNGKASYCYGCYQMQEDSDGDYVRYDDYVALRARVKELEAANVELERLCESTYVAQGADAYNHACELTEQWDADRGDKGLAPIYPAGESRSLCGWIESIRELLDGAEATIAGLRADAERYQEIRRGAKVSVINGIGDTLTGQALDCYIGSCIAARAAQATPVANDAAAGECPVCQPDGLRATDGTGPWDCYQCGKSADGSVGGG